VIRPGKAGDLPGDAAFTRALASDPEGVFVALDGGGGIVGRAVGFVRDGTLLLVSLSVAREARGGGLGTALLERVRAYGAGRGATALEGVTPLEGGSLGFLAKRGLPIRALLLTLRGVPSASAAAPPIVPVPPGAAFGGWVAELDRETRGYARRNDWAAWLRDGMRALALKKGGRPEAIGGLASDGAGGARLGPLAARTPSAAADLLTALVSRAAGEGARTVELTVAADARTLLATALELGLAVERPLALFGSRTREDLRRALFPPSSPCERECANMTGPNLRRDTP
jgi:hypothetical protein